MRSPETNRNEPNRLYVNDDLRKNSERFLITRSQLPASTLVVPSLPQLEKHTFFNIMERERESLDVPVSRHSLNVAQFVAVVSAMTEGVELQQSETQLPEHFKNFQDSFRSTGELSLVAFDMDDLTLTNKKYTHLHGSIVCSTLERTILQTGERLNGLLASMGEENILALPLKMEDANVVTNIILDRFTSIPFDFAGEEFHQGVSAGISSLKRSSPRSFRRLMELSGGALVYTKKHGKGFATMFGDE